MDQETVKVGLLMETAHSHQRLAGASLKQLKAHTHDLTALVREEVRSTLVSELKSLASESARAAAALQAVRRAANVRVALWSGGITACCGALALGVASWILPSRDEIAALRARRADLESTIANLEQQGGRIDLRRCGTARRWCVRVDRKAPAFGAAADYLIVQGY